MSSDHLFCKTCGISYLSIEQLNFHESSKTHLDKLKAIGQGHIREGNESRGFNVVLRSFDDEPISRVNNIFEPVVSRGKQDGILQNVTFNNMSKIETNGNNLIAMSENEIQQNFAHHYEWFDDRNDNDLSNSSSFELGRLNLSETQEYSFDRISKKGKCFICDVELSSYQQAEDHIKGKCHWHKRASIEKLSKHPEPAVTVSEEAAVYTHSFFQEVDRNSPINTGPERNVQSVDPNILMCSVCNAPFSSPFNMKQHFAGKKHRREMMKRGFCQNPVNEETKRHEAITGSDNGLNTLSPGMKMMASRNEPRLEDCELNEVKHHVTTFQPGGNLPAHEMTLLPVKEKSPVKFERTVSENLNDKNDKVTPIKDKLMDNPFFVPTIPTTLLENNPSSWLSSITDNCQQPLFTPQQYIHQERKPYVFDGEKGTCFICAVEITSLKLAQQHLNGQPHQKKLKQWEEMRMQSPRAQSVRVENAFTTLTGREMIMPSNHHLSQNHVNDQDYVKFDGIKGFCRACNTELTSSLQAAQHIEGKPHKRNVQRLRMTEQGVRYPLRCNICQKEFTGQESATDHFVSEKHKRNESLLNCDRTEVLENGRKIFLQNGTIWLSCDVCRKVLNTLEQFNIHCESPQHLAELNKKRGNSELNLSSDSRDIFETPGTSGSSTPRYATSSPIQNSKRSSIDSLGAMDKIKELLTYGENPVVNIDHSTTLKKEFLQPQISVTNSDPVAREVGFAELNRRNDENENIASFDQDNLEHQGKNDISPDCNTGAFGYQLGTGIRPNMGGDNSNERGNWHSSPNVQSNRCSSRINSNSYNQPNATGGTSYGERYQTKDKDESQLSESTGREGLSSFGNVTTGYKRSTRGSTREKGQRSQFNLAQDDDTESSSDENEEEDVGNRNIQGDEETQPETRRSQTGETSQSSKVPIASGRKHKYDCPLCKIEINSKKSLKDHEKGKMHQWNLSNMKAPFQDLDLIDKTGRLNTQHIFTMSINPPRVYQVKLTEKAMSSDCVVYLPTGTGKTMVSVLTIGLMLEKNPKRPVIFLVDKVLLVIQQAKYIETELKDKVFRRPSVEPNHNDDLVERKLNLAFVCRGLLRNNNLPIWKHDIIVTTADYCINMLNNGVILWEDFSLAVLDEAHHCVKKHPYQKLIKNYHRKITDPKKRPKILGLTASPAGKSSVGATYEMLQCLLHSLGGAKIAIVEEDNLRELKIYQSSPRLCQFCVSLNDKEKRFQEQCIKYFLQCYIKLAPLSSTLKNNDEPPCSYFLPALKYPSEESLQNITQSFMTDSAPLSEILPLIFECITNAEGDELSKFEHLRTHTFTILLNIADIPTGINFKELKSAFTESPENYVLHAVKAFGLPCDLFYKQILNFEEEEGNAEPAMIGELMRILEDPDYVDWGKKDSMALVLVRERKSAKSLSKKLRHKQFIIKNTLRVTHLVGHGKRTQGDGMTVKDQHKVLRNQEKYQILVATSIAEEGIDINKLELVISMNPPSNVTALVQMRGRARKKESHFVILCSNEEEMRKLDELKQQEENMMEAAKKYIENE